MRARLLHRDRDVHIDRALPPAASDLREDLELDAVLDAMGGGDSFLSDVALQVLFEEPRPSAGTIKYRQAILADVLEAPDVIRAMYAIAVRAVGKEREHWWGLSSRHPSGVLHGAVGLMKALLGDLRAFRGLIDEEGGRFRSGGLTRLFATLQAELTEDYLEDIEREMERLSFEGELRLTARLGPGNEGTDYVLQAPGDDRGSFLGRLLDRGPEGYSFRIHERDMAGARILSELRNLGLYDVAIAVGRATGHVLGFFQALRTELAFYVGCLNLRDALTALDTPICIPRRAPEGSRRLRFQGLRDPSLALGAGHAVVGSDLDIESARLGIVTGANEGGKSTFLRSLGLAHLMLGAGIFVAAGSFEAEPCPNLFTHFSREEDAELERGHFDEELARLDAIVEELGRGDLVLFNESFGSTNEREGSEIARDVVRALLESDVRVFFVTHMYAFARGCFEDSPRGTVFLRAEREADGTRTFRIVRGEPLQTSFAEDVFEEVFGDGASQEAVG